jgi:hypothetical protein
MMNPTDDILPNTTILDIRSKWFRVWYDKREVPKPWSIEDNSTHRYTDATYARKRAAERESDLEIGALKWKALVASKQTKQNEELESKMEQHRYNKSEGGRKRRSVGLGTLGCIFLALLLSGMLSGCATAQWPHEIETIGPYDPGLTSHQEALGWSVRK